MKKYIIGITGASGSIIGKKIITYLSHQSCEMNLVLTDHGRQVFEYETEQSFEHFIQKAASSSAHIIVHDNHNMFSAIASGSYGIDSMIIAPCSMATAARIANGTGGDLLCRAADVCIKEKERFVISPRESPLSSIHMRNLLTLSDLGARIVLPVPMFYSKIKDVDIMIEGIAGRILKAAGIDNTLYQKWGE